MNTEHTFFKIGNKKIAIGMSWMLIDKPSQSGRDKRAAQEIKTTHLNYGVMTNNSLMINEEEVTTSLLALTSEEQRGAYVGAHLVAKKIKNAAFFTQVSSEHDDDSSENLFWLCAIDENSQVIPEYDLILTEDVLAQKLSDLQSLESESDLYAPQEFFRVFPDSDIKALEIKSLIKGVTLTDYSIVDLRKKTNFVLLAASLLAISLSSYIAYEYVYKENPVIEEIRSGLLLEDVNIKESAMRANSKKTKKSKVLTQVESNQLANSQLEEIFDQQFYSKEDIINNIKTMVEVLPEFLVEWNLKQTTYNKNAFVFVYERITDSTGSFNEMASSLNNLLASKGIKYQYLGSDEELTISTYRMYFESTKEKEYLYKKSQQEELKLANNNDPTKPIFDEIDKVKSEIDDLSYEASMLSFSDKRWGSAPDEIKDQILSQIALIESNLLSVKKIQKREKELNDTSKMIVQNGLVKHDIYYNSFLNKAQLNPSLSISIPAKLAELPFISMDKKAKKSRRNKGKKSKNKTNVMPLVDVYEFKMESKDSTIGIDQAYESMKLIDNKSIIYFNVDYNINTNTWAVRGNMYETKL